MKNIFAFAIVALAFTSCSKGGEEPITNDPQGGNSGKTITVSIDADASPTTRVSYDEGSSNYPFSWDNGDKITIIDPSNGAGGRSWYDFTTTDEGLSTATFSGELVSWSGSKTLYAYHNPSEESVWNPGSFNNSFGSYWVESGNQDQYIPSANDNFGDGKTYYDRLNVENGTMELYQRNNGIAASSTKSILNKGLLVGASNGATAESESDYHIPTINFNQVMSFFQVQLNGFPSDLDIVYVQLITTDALNYYLTTDEYDPDYSGAKPFYDSAEVSMSTGEVVRIPPTTGSYDESNFDEGVGNEISGFSASNNVLTFPIFPVDLSSTPLSLTVDVSNEKNEASIYYINLNSSQYSTMFARNTVHTGEVDFSQFTEYIYSKTYTLSDFATPGFSHEGEEWIITDSGTPSTQDFAGLRNYLLANPDLRISLEFTALDAIPANALSGTESNPIRSLEYVRASAEYEYTDNSTILVHEGVNSIGASAFANCVNLKEVTASYHNGTNEYGMAITSIASIGEGCFENCSNLKNAPTPSTIPARAFKNCSSLYSLSNSYSGQAVIRSIGDEAFMGCTSLGTSDPNNMQPSIPGTTPDTRAKLALTASTIGNRAFYGCDQIEVIELPPFYYTQNPYTQHSTKVISLGAEAFHRASVGGSGSEPYTNSIELQVAQISNYNINYRTLTVGNVGYTFGKILIDDVETTPTPDPSGASATAPNAGVSRW